MRAAITRAILGSLPNIADALASAQVEEADLYEVADALRAASNRVLAVALDAVALKEGRRLVSCRQNGEGRA